MAEFAGTLDPTYREVAGRLDHDTDLTVDDEGKAARLRARRAPHAREPAGALTGRGAMLPRVSLPEVVVEVMSWLPGFAVSFTSVSGGRSRLEDLEVTIAGCLCAHAMNIGFEPIIKRGVPALECGRVSHVDQNYLGAEAYRAANPHLIAHQDVIPYAQALGGGMVAGIDGMRFVVRVPSICARPNRKYFGPDRGVTLLNMISDRAMGLAGSVSGAPRDSLHVLDVAFSQDQGQRPDILIADTGTQSDLIFGLCPLLGLEYRPELADMPDQRGWRTDRNADYAPLNTLARGRIDLERIRRHWPGRVPAARSARRLSSPHSGVWRGSEQNLALSTRRASRVGVPGELTGLTSARPQAKRERDGQLPLLVLCGRELEGRRRTSNAWRSGRLGRVDGETAPRAHKHERRRGRRRVPKAVAERGVAC